MSWWTESLWWHWTDHWWTSNYSIPSFLLAMLRFLFHPLFSECRRYPLYLMFPIDKRHNNDVVMCWWNFEDISPSVSVCCWVSPGGWLWRPPPCAGQCRVSHGGCLPRSEWTVSWLGFSQCFLGLIIWQSLAQCNPALCHQYVSVSHPAVPLIVPKGEKFLVIC